MVPPQYQAKEPSGTFISVMLLAHSYTFFFFVQTKERTSTHVHFLNRRKTLRKVIIENKPEDLLSFGLNGTSLLLTCTGSGV